MAVFEESAYWSDAEWSDHYRMLMEESEDVAAGLEARLLDVMASRDAARARTDEAEAISDEHRIAREILRERLGASEAQVAALRSALGKLAIEPHTYRCRLCGRTPQMLMVNPPKYEHHAPDCVLFDSPTFRRVDG